MSREVHPVQPGPSRPPGAWPGVLAAVATAVIVAAAIAYNAQGGQRPDNVVIVTLDTTRADRLSAYGYMNATTPHLDRLAAEGVVFNQAQSVAPLTLPAHASLFTGLLPPAHGVRDNAGEALAANQTTLAEILRAHGFRTGAFVGSIVLEPKRGLAQGFDVYDSVASPGAGLPLERRQRRAEEVIDRATAWLSASAGERFLLWAHLYDPHRPYDPPEPFRSISDPYLGEIAYADSQLGRLVGALEARGLLDRTLLVVAGDHGESLGDHGERDHGIFVYESVVRVPLIVRAPGLRPARVAEVVRLTDILPTVLETLGIPEIQAVDGVSLSGLMRGTARNLGLEAYAESLYPQRFGWSALHAIREERFKFIDAPRPELYDLERDPFEQRNIYDERPVLARALRERLTAIRARHSADPAPQATGVSAELRESLAALGYVASTPRPAIGGSDSLLDPKDCIAAAEASAPTRRAAAAAVDPRCLQPER